jgi:hypothetical protein
MNLATRRLAWISPRFAFVISFSANLRASFAFATVVTILLWRKREVASADKVAFL